MLSLAVGAGGALAAVAAWRLVATGRVSIWPAMSVTLGIAGALAVATGRVSASGRMSLPLACAAGVVAGALLYLATVAFVLVVRRWPVFERHVDAIYDQRGGLPLPAALLLAAGVTATGEELLWRGLVQARLSAVLGGSGAALATWAAYAAVNAASGNLPIAAGGVVGGAVWGALAAWTQGVAAPIASHAVWTALMLALPPAGRRSPAPPPAARRPS